MGIPVSLILIAVGAILAFAINQDPGSAVDIDVVGWILMLVGLAGLLLSLLLWERWGPGYWGWHRAPAPYPGRGTGRAGESSRKRTLLDRRQGRRRPNGQAARTPRPAPRPSA